MLAAWVLKAVASKGPTPPAPGVGKLFVRISVNLTGLLDKVNTNVRQRSHLPVISLIANVDTGVKQH